MRIVIMGCGRVGARLATSFSRAGHEVAVLDRNPDSFARLDEQFAGSQTRGSGIDPEDLDKAGTAQAQVFIAVTDNDNANIMAAQIAKTTFKVPKVIARIYDPIRAGAYKELGLTTVCPTETVAGIIEKEVSRKG
jgi:trk system potassium uptake protein TrkA